MLNVHCALLPFHALLVSQWLHKMEINIPLITLVGLSAALLAQLMHIHSQ